MRKDERWRASMLIEGTDERHAAYKALRVEYGVGEIATKELACAHWKASGWMTHLLDRRSANALGGEVWQSVEAWLYRGAGRPRTQHSKTRNVAQGQDLDGGLSLRPDVRPPDRRKPKAGASNAGKKPVSDWKASDLRVVWGSQTINRSSERLGRKRLELSLDWSCLPATRRAYVQASLPSLRRVGIRREIVRDQVHYWALLCLDCAPYRSIEYQERLATRPVDSILGLDMGPTEQAWVTETDSGVIKLGTDALFKAKATAAAERRLQRAMDRSRRASNSDCYDERGRVIRGKRPRNLSKRGQRLASEHKELRRKGAAQRKRETIIAAQEAALLASHVRVEDQNFSSWQASGYGKRMAVTLPGLFLARLDAELKLTNGLAKRLPLRSAFSQYCICGSKVKKPRGQDWHQCEQAVCPIQGLRLNRHLFSAWLMRVTASTQHGSIAALHEGTLKTLLMDSMGGETVLQESVIALCAIRRGRVKHPEGDLTKARKRDREIEGVTDRTAQEAKPTQALPDRSTLTCVLLDVPRNAALLEDPISSP